MQNTAGAIIRGHWRRPPQHLFRQSLQIKYVDRERTSNSRSMINVEIEATSALVGVTKEQATALARKATSNFLGCTGVFVKGCLACCCGGLDANNWVAIATCLSVISLASPSTESETTTSAAQISYFPFQCVPVRARANGIAWTEKGSLTFAEIVKTLSSRARRFPCKFWK